MKRSLWVLFAITLALLSGPASAQGIRVVLNEREMTFDQPPAMLDGRLMVPLRGIFEALSADVLYDGASRTIKATKGPTIVELTLGSRVARLDGRTVYLDVPAGTLGGRTMVPLRFVSEALGAEVKWDGANRTVRISDQSTAALPDPPPEPQPPSGARPSIDKVIHNATRALQAGDTVDVVMTGDPGGQASFQILGVTASIPMREVGKGRYEASFTVPRGASVEQGVLTGQLAKNGAESVAEASRPITIQAAGQPPALPPQVGSSLAVTRTFPANNSMIANVRPPIGVELAGNQSNLTARFQVDQFDVTSQAQQRGKRLVWNPSFDLDPGAHTVTVDVSDGSGAPVRASWTFTVGSQPQPGGGGGLQVNNPQNGASLPGTFFVQGRATPGSIITVQLSYQQMSPVFANKILWGRGRADGGGNFRIEMDAEDVPVGASMSLVVLDGLAASPSLQLRRR